jgi:hypothetical protein
LFGYKGIRVYSHPNRDRGLKKRNNPLHEVD